MSSYHKYSLFFMFEMIIASFLLLFPPSNLYSYKTLTHAPTNNPNDAQWSKRHGSEMDLVENGRA